MVTSPKRHKTARNLSSPIDLHTHAGSAFDNRVTLAFDLLTSGSMHVDACHRVVMLIAQAGFL